jgi:archaeosortase A (PGF-CTERM-specific)
MASKNSEKSWSALFFIIAPTILVVIGILFFPLSLVQEINYILSIPLFLGLFLLVFGYFSHDKEMSSRLKMAGWCFFAFYWSALPNTLYYGEDGDIFNASLCVVGVYVLFYFAYHEWLSIHRKEELRCLQWAVGSAALAGLIYFGIEKTPLAPILIELVAIQSAALLNFFTGDVTTRAIHIFCSGNYVVSIIFACTAVQSMVLFVGMILPLQRVQLKRKLFGLGITVIPIYFLNLIRNAMIAYFISNDITDFYMAHNIIGKGGSLIALMILLFLVSKGIPEIFDEIIALTDLPKRNGPLEHLVHSVIGSSER